MAFEKRAAAWKDVFAALRDLVILVAILFALLWPSQVRELFTKAGIKSFFGLVVEKTTNELRDLQEAQKAAEQQIKRNERIIREQSMARGAEGSAGRRYAIVFSGNRRMNDAVSALRRASGIRSGSLSLYLRKSVFRSVAEFGSYQAANENLGTYRRTWEGAYIVTLNSWCPTTKPLPVRLPTLVKDVTALRCVD